MGGFGCPPLLWAGCAVCCLSCGRDSVDCLSLRRERQRETERETKRERDRKRERHKEREREIERERERQRDKTY